MEDIRKQLVLYKEKTKASNVECASLLNLSVEQIDCIERNEIVLDDAEQKRVLAILQTKTKSLSKRIVKILDLFLRFVSMIMSVVTLLLCINGYNNLETLITLLSIGFVSTSIIMLPRN